MKKILLSILTIFATGALTAGATGAWMQSGGGHHGYDFDSGKIDLKVDHTHSVYDGLECVHGYWKGGNSPHAGDPCKEWDPKDLSTKDKFYLFSDIKPGDWGRDIISLHVKTKESLNVCLFADDVTDQENKTNEPEKTAGDTSKYRGELSKFIKLFAWLDLNQDGLFNPKAGEKKLYQGLLKDESISLTLEKNKAAFIGTAWCVGEQSINMTTGGISCDGSKMGDISQTDSLKLSLIGYAEAKRWYSGLRCGDVSGEYHKRYGGHEDEHEKDDDKKNKHDD